MKKDYILILRNPFIILLLIFVSARMVDDYYNRYTEVPNASLDGAPLYKQPDDTLKDLDSPSVAADIVGDDIKKMKELSAYDTPYIRKMMNGLGGIQLSPEMELQVIQSLNAFEDYPELKSLNDTSFEQGMNNDIRGSLNTINQGLAIDPDNIFLLTKKAGTLFGLGNPSECISILKDIVDYPPAMKGIAMCYFGNRDYGKAQFYTYRALELMPSDIGLQVLKDKLVNY